MLGGSWRSCMDIQEILMFSLEVRIIYEIFLIPITSFPLPSILHFYFPFFLLFPLPLPLPLSTFPFPLSLSAFPFFLAFLFPLLSHFFSFSSRASPSASLYKMFRFYPLYRFKNIDFYSSSEKKHPSLINHVNFWVDSFKFRVIVKFVFIERKTLTLTRGVFWLGAN